ncbi:MAG: amidohydrolase, partial [Alphaproteobacteria bacterium]
MSLERGGIDCDIHPAVPGMDALLPYLGGHWREAVVQRGVHELNSIAYPQHAPLSARPDWRTGKGRPGSDLEAVRSQALAPFGTNI